MRLFSQPEHIVGMLIGAGECLRSKRLSARRFRELAFLLEFTLRDHEVKFVAAKSFSLDGCQTLETHLGDELDCGTNAPVHCDRG